MQIRQADVEGRAGRVVETSDQLSVRREVNRTVVRAPLHRIICEELPIDNKKDGF